MPYYSGILGRGWLEAGHSFAQACIRGGGEYGPAWHKAATQQNKQKSYEDFEAVARQIRAEQAASGNTDGELFMQGGSNGGLLAGNMYVRNAANVTEQQPRPLFDKVISECPLLDMQRYTKLLAGSSWIAEYGDPSDSKQWSFMREFSPFHMADGTFARALRKEKESATKILLTSSTKDDRVHPAHARKMAAKLQALGIDNVYYFENMEGGHSGAADHKQVAFLKALEYGFLGGV